MSPDPQTKLVRRVVTGLNDEGRSTIVSDRETPTWVRRPTGSVIMEVWRTDSLPALMDNHPSDGGEPLAPSVGGICVRVAVFPPDDDIEAEDAAAYEAAMHQLYGDQGEAAAASVPGMHRTETIDIITVVEGEIWLVLEDAEALLRAGDTLVQRGTRHAWKNRSDRPCTLASTVLSARYGS